MNVLVEVDEIIINANSRAYFIQLVLIIHLLSGEFIKTGRLHLLRGNGGREFFIK